MTSKNNQNNKKTIALFLLIGAFTVSCYLIISQLFFNLVSAAAQQDNFTNQSEKLVAAGNKKLVSNHILLKVKKEFKNSVKEGLAINSGLVSLQELDKTKKINNFRQLSKDTGWYLVELNIPHYTVNSAFVNSENQSSLANFFVPSNSELQTLGLLNNAKNKITTDPKVELAEYDYEVNSLAIPNDPLISQQWGVTKISAPSAWDSQTDASDVVVAVIDTGIDFTHPDLQGNFYTNQTDGSHGWTCLNGACTPVAGGVQDDFGHGTHVAGIIAAATNNNIGVAGVNWKNKLLSCKFLKSSGSGYISDAVLCFNQILALKQQGLNIRVTSNSWGGGAYTQALKDAMQALENLGIVNVCAAGNNISNADLVPMYPAAYNNRGIISVSATENNDFITSFSNYGLASVDIAAPGQSILSTVPNGSCSLCDASGYKFLSGTSMATPFVSGVVAALAHLNPNLNALQLRDEILNPASYDAVTDQTALMSTSGGRLNYYKAIKNPKLYSPGMLNNFPTISGLTNVSASAGQMVNLNPVSTDLDGDNLSSRLITDIPTSGGGGLVGCMEKMLFPSTNNNSLTFNVPTINRDAVSNYYFSVADGHGGGAVSSAYVTLKASSNSGQAPTGEMSITQTPIDATNTKLNFAFSGTDPENNPFYWDYWAVSANTGGGASCLLPGQAASYVVVPNPSVSRVSMQAIDTQLNLSDRYTTVVRVGNATGTPPLIKATLSAVSGTAPLSVDVDMSETLFPDGVPPSLSNNEVIMCDYGVNNNVLSGPKATCTYNTPGTYWVVLVATDNNGLRDYYNTYVVVTPSATSLPPAMSHINLTPVSFNFSATSTGPAPAAQTLIIGNSGNANLNWTASTDKSWCHLSSMIGAVSPGSSANISVYVDAPSNIGNFNCNIIVNSSDADNSPQSAMVTYSVTEPRDSTPPSAPQKLTANAVSYNQVNLTWATSTDNVAVTGYNIYKNGVHVGASNTNTYTDLLVLAGSSYTYYVTAFDAAGNESGQSNSATVTTPTLTKIAILTTSVNNILANAATINWTTNIQSIGTVRYGTNRNSMTNFVTDPKAGTTHTINLTNLINNTIYYFQIQATSTEIGNNSTILSPVNSFKTLKK